MQVTRKTLGLLMSVALGASICARGNFLSEYKGTPFHDERFRSGAQKVPGRLECAYYDFGGEGVAYHDADAKNNGSGALNPADGTYLNEFRLGEGVDISYTKYHDAIDKNPYNKVQPPENQLYVGWTAPGEWFNLTVDAAKAGWYEADLLYTSNRGGTLSVDVNGKNATGPLELNSTFNDQEPVAWRQWHHWDLQKNFARLQLAAGRNVLTMRILTKGNMNLAYLELRNLSGSAGKTEGVRSGSGIGRPFMNRERTGEVPAEERKPEGTASAGAGKGS